MAATPTPQQLEMLRQLSPEQQAAILKTLPADQVRGTRIEQKAEEPPQVVIPAPAGKPAARKVSPGKESPDKQEPAPLPQTEELPRFGYDLFAGVPTTFAPATEIPVPVDYIIGPGDTIQVQLYGGVNAQYNLVVTREGVLEFPQLGPIAVAGMRFADLRQSLASRVSQQMFGTKATVSMGPLRSIRVFVLGDANQPGSYTVSALSTMTNALFVSGGVKPIGSLRAIQLKRAGKTVTQLDLYDLLLRGDTSADQRLLPGDVIFVPPAGSSVGVGGEVKRPATYELRQEKSVAELLQLAGGLLPTAYPEGAQLERIGDDRARTLLDVNLTRQVDLARPLRDGDVLRVRPVLEQMEKIVMLEGHVQRPGAYQWRDGMRLSELIGDLQSLRPEPDLQYVLIQREVPPDRRVAIFSTSLAKAMAARGGADDPLLAARDRVRIFDRVTPRTEQLKPVITALQSQAQHDQPSRAVRIDGRVRFPGEYPLEEGMHVSRLVQAAGDLQESAYALEAEITRFAVVDGAKRQISHQTVSLSDVLQGKPDADIILQPYDILNVKELPNWREQDYVELKGEVRFPGTYPVSRGETLSQLVQRAGGFTELAYLQGAVFMREDLRKREQQNFDRMAERLRNDLAALSLEKVQGDGSKAQAVQVANELVAQITSTKAMGRLVIDLDRVMEGKSQDVVLQNGDTLLIPPRQQEVTVMGEVFFPTSHLYSEDLSLDEFIKRSGGSTSRADSKRTYVVRANGAVVPGSTGWFSKPAPVYPGDTIIVPPDVERVNTLLLWTNVSQILYQLGIAAASWKTVGLF